MHLIAVYTWSITICVIHVLLYLFLQKTSTQQNDTANTGKNAQNHSAQQNLEKGNSQDKLISHKQKYITAERTKSTTECCTENFLPKKGLCKKWQQQQNETDEQLLGQRRKDAERQRKTRACKSEEQLQERRRKNAERQRSARLRQQKLAQKVCQTKFVARHNLSTFD